MEEEKFRLLMVNDNPVTVEMMRNILRHHRHLKPEVAVFAQDALDKLKNSPPYHIILTDLTTPYFTTLDVMRAAKSRSPDTKVIMVSSFGSQQAVIDAIKAGVYSYIHKPFRPDELNLALTNVTEHFRRRKQLSELAETLKKTREELHSRDQAIAELTAKLKELEQRIDNQDAEQGEGARDLDAAIEEAAARKTGAPVGYRLYRDLTDLDNMLEDNKITAEEFQEIRKSILDRTYKIPLGQV